MTTEHQAALEATVRELNEKLAKHESGETLLELGAAADRLERERNAARACLALLKSVAQRLVSVTDIRVTRQPAWTNCAAAARNALSSITVDAGDVAERLLAEHDAALARGDVLREALLNFTNGDFEGDAQQIAAAVLYDPDKAASERDERLKVEAREVGQDDRKWRRALESALDAALARVSKLEAFKAYVHKRLDDAGVPANPEPEENAEHGCRNEGRLNYLIGIVENDEDREQVLAAERDAALARVGVLREVLELYPLPTPKENHPHSAVAFMQAIVTFEHARRAALADPDKAATECDGRLKAEAVKEVVALLHRVVDWADKMRPKPDGETVTRMVRRALAKPPSEVTPHARRVFFDDAVELAAKPPSEAKTPPCGGDRCHFHAGKWIHSSKSYSTCAVNRTLGEPIFGWPSEAKTPGKGGG